MLVLFCHWVACGLGLLCKIEEANNELDHWLSDGAGFAAQNEAGLSWAKARRGEARLR